MEKVLKKHKQKTIIILFIWIGIALIGCKAPKVIEKENIIIKDSIHYVQSYRDTTIYYTIPGDTIHDTTNIYISKGLVNSKPITLENLFSISTAYVKNSKLYLSLIAKDTTLQIRLDSAIRESKYYRFMYEKNINSKDTIVEVNKTPWYIKSLIVILILLLVYFILNYLKIKFLGK